MLRNRSMRTKPRRGVVVVLAVFFLAILLSFMSFAVDFGYLVNAKAELQRAADASAMSACWQYANGLSFGSHQTAAANGYQEARTTAAVNEVCNSGLELSSNNVTWGRLNNFADRSETMDTSDSDIFNAVEVTVSRNNVANGQVPLFFAKIFGLTGVDVEASATAAVVRDIGGFATPSDGSNLHIMPFAVKRQHWESLQSGGGSDNWTWDPVNKTVTPGGDGINELDIYPHNTGSSGNSGTVDIGSNNNSTADLSRQITDGISPSDMAHHGGSLELDCNGELDLNGDTGISAGIKDELAAIIGEPRTVPIYKKVTGPGNNAQYTIVKWVGVRVMEVKLTGSKKQKRLMIQPAPIIVTGVIPSVVVGTSEYIYSPVVLIR